MRIGVIGYGRRMQGLLRMVEKFATGAEVAGIADPNFDEIREDIDRRGRRPHECPVFEDADGMLDEIKPDAVMVGTRCSLHAKMGIKTLERRLPLYLEKPVATNREDLSALAAAGKGNGARVVVSFPLRVSPLVTTVKEIVESGKVGTVEAVNAWCDPPYADTYYCNWYRDEKETGGLWLQKATHDFDYISHLLGSRAKRVAAMTTRRVFKGTKPAGLRCKDCDEWEDCLESPFHIYFSRGESEGVAPDVRRMCMFAEDTGNEDSGHAIVEFEDGVVASYSQNFMVRKSAGRRGARLYGYKGTIEFDWYRDEAKVFMHHSPKVETHTFESSSLSHAGGDDILIWNFLKVAEGEAESLSPLEAGIGSVRLCLAARESSESGRFVGVAEI
ncbi:MAG: Gfo/Idh/MocA family protein [Planctomycetota bacterium]|jgi:predicted dehydrogenase